MRGSGSNGKVTADHCLTSDGERDAMGRGRYLIFYLLGGLAAMVAQVAADPHSTVPNLGASGAVAAVMGAFMGYLSSGSVIRRWRC